MGAWHVCKSLFVFLGIYRFLLGAQQYEWKTRCPEQTERNRLLLPAPAHVKPGHLETDSRQKSSDGYWQGGSDDEPRPSGIPRRAAFSLRWNRTGGRGIHGDSHFTGRAIFRARQMLP